MTGNPYESKRLSPSFGPIVLGVLLAMIVGLIAIYVLRPGRNGADDSRTAAAISNMDAAQNKADKARDDERRATALLN